MEYRSSYKTLYKYGGKLCNYFFHLICMVLYLFSRSRNCFSRESVRTLFTDPVKRNLTKQFTFSHILGVDTVDDDKSRTMLKFPNLLTDESYSDLLLQAFFLNELRMVTSALFLHAITESISRFPHLFKVFEYSERKKTKCHWQKRKLSDCMIILL